MGSIRSLILGSNINSLFPLPTRSQLLEIIKDVTWGVKHTGGWSDFSIVFGQLCRANFTATSKSSFHWFLVVAGAPMTPSIRSNTTLKNVITWCKVTVCLFDIHRVQYENGLKTSMTYLTIVHSSCVVKSGRYLLNFGFLSHWPVNPRNQ